MRINKTTQKSWYSLRQGLDPSGRHVTRWYAVMCRECDAAESMHSNGMTDEQLRKWFLRKGWDIGKKVKSHTCPECQDKKKPPHPVISTTSVLASARIISLTGAANILGVNELSLQRNYPDKIIQHGKYRRRMRVADVIEIGKTDHELLQFNAEPLPPEQDEVEPPIELIEEEVLRKAEAQAKKRLQAWNSARSEAIEQIKLPPEPALPEPPPVEGISPLMAAWETSNDNQRLEFLTWVEREFGVRMLNADVPQPAPVAPTPVIQLESITPDSEPASEPTTPAEDDEPADWWLEMVAQRQQRTPNTTSLRPSALNGAARPGEKRQPWKDVEVQCLKEWAREHVSAASIAKTLSRTERAVRQKAFALGLSLETRRKEQA